MMPDTANTACAAAKSKAQPRRRWHFHVAGALERLFSLSGSQMVSGGYSEAYRSMASSWLPGAVFGLHWKGLFWLSGAQMVSADTRGVPLDCEFLGRRGFGRRAAETVAVEFKVRQMT